MGLEKMKPGNALLIFNNSCYETLGIDSNGNEVTKTLPFAMTLTGAGVPTFISEYSGARSKESIKPITTFLREWADALEGLVE